MKKILVSLAVLSIIGGCSSSGNVSIKDETHTSIGNKLAKGMSMIDVRANLGDPLNIRASDSGNNIIWRYEFTKANVTVQSFIPFASYFSSGVEGKSKTLVVVFDENDKVKRYNLSDSDFKSTTGIIEQ